jgi:serine/threonine protein kinase
VTKVAAEVGTTANRYQILAKLASGGMAEIFLARGASVAGVERYCVLKRVLRERASDAELVEMFVHEARLAAQLQHPNIASVYDIGMLGDSYFFTMEYVHGETIRSLLHRAHTLDRPLPLACVLTIIAGAAAGLHHAHERNSSDGRPLGIVHRDVSPSNLMVSYEGNVKVVDFGVAKAEDRTIETRAGTVKGKITYLSPEQCRGVQVDRRSDVFSLGIVLWEMLTGERLYRRDSDFDNMTSIVNDATPPPSTLRPDLPPAIDDLVARLLVKSAADRVQTAAAVVDAIEAASLETGTVLSISTVGRLMRELFGVRAEPWLELEGGGDSHVPSTIESRPVPLELGRDIGAAVAAQIAGRREPAASRLAAAARNASTFSGSGSQPGPPVERVTEVAAPGELPPLEPVAVDASVASAIELAVRAPPSSGTGTHTTTFARPARVDARDAAPGDPEAAPGAVSATPASTAVPTEPPAERPDDPLDRPAERPRHGPDGGGVRAAVASSGPTAAPRALPPAASRAGRRLAAVSAVAVVVGVIAMRPAADPTSPTSAILATRPPATGTPSHALETVRAEAAMQAGAALAINLPSNAAGPRTSDAGSPPRARPASAPGPRAGEPAPRPSAASLGDPRPAATDAPPRPAATDAPPRPFATDAPSPPAGSLGEPRPSTPADPRPSTPADPRPSTPADPRPRQRAAIAVAPRRTPTPAAPAQPALPAPESAPSGDAYSRESVSRLYRSADLARVLQICSSVPLSRDIADICVMASCQEHDSAHAARWRPFVDPAKRDQLAALCKDRGGEIGTTLDCAANPLDCR